MEDQEQFEFEKRDYVYILGGPVQVLIREDASSIESIKALRQLADQLEIDWNRYFSRL